MSHIPKKSTNKKRQSNGGELRNSPSPKKKEKIQDQILFWNSVYGIYKISTTRKAKEIYYSEVRVVPEYK